MGGYNNSMSGVRPTSKVMAAPSRLSRITIIRETQTLRKTAALGAVDPLRESEGSINQKAKEVGEPMDGLAYKDMKDSYYYSSTIIYYALIIVGSCLIPSVDEIFEFVGVICVNCLAFMFPSTFYLTAVKRYHKNNSALLNPAVTKRNKCLEATAYFQIAFGIVVFCAGMFNNIHGLIDTSKGEH